VSIQDTGLASTGATGFLPPIYLPIVLYE
jgi:hypothetical protein